MMSLKRSNPDVADREITAEEKQQAKEFFAKVAISEADSKLSSQGTAPNFLAKTRLQVQLQQAQFLAKIYSEANAAKTSVSETEIDEFIKVHPEFNVAEKKAKAEAILARAKAGENFASLANEFSDDPGNLGLNGNKQGGLYADVPKGRMLAAFENAALALKPGEVSPALVETDYGYHIIKLEKQSEAKQPNGTSELTYNVRHILISTTQKNPEDPTAREIPIKEFVRSKLETQKESKFIATVIANNPVEIAAIPVAPPPPVKKRPVKRRRVRRK